MYGGDDDHTDNRSGLGGHLAECLGEVAVISTGFEYIGDGELPAQERAEAGHNHEAHDDPADGGSEHGSEYITEGGNACYDFFCGNDAEDDVGGENVAGCCKEGASEYRSRYILFRIIDSIRIGTGRFHTEECPECHGDGVVGGIGEGQVVNVPVGHVHIAGEPEPAEDGQAYAGNDDAPYRDGGNLAGVLRSAEVQHGCQPQGENGPDAGHYRCQGNVKELGAVSHCGDGNRDIGEKKRNTVGVVGHEVAGFAEGIFSVAAHAAASSAVHAALCEGIGEAHGPDGGDEPGNDRERTYLGQLGGEHDDARSHHVDGSKDGQLQDAHFICRLTHNLLLWKLMTAESEGSDELLMIYFS